MEKEEEEKKNFKNFSSFEASFERPNLNFSTLFR